jgi:hypothetical protein
VSFRRLSAFQEMPAAVIMQNEDNEKHYVLRKTR